MPTPDWFQLGLGGLALAALVLGYRGWWYFGPQVDRMTADYEKRLAAAERECEQWRELFLEQLGIAKVAVHNVPEPGAGK